MKRAGDRDGGGGGLRKRARAAQRAGGVNPWGCVRGGWTRCLGTWVTLVAGGRLGRGILEP